MQCPDTFQKSHTKKQTNKQKKNYSAIFNCIVAKYELLMSVFPL